VAVYGVDTSGNTNKPVVTQFRCTAAGLAPMSVAGYQSGVTDGTNTSYSYVLSFDLASYVRFSARTNDHGEVGTYTYTPTGPDTAELVPNRVFPTGDTNSNPPLELTFTNAFGATYIQGSNSGTLDFMLAGDIVPATLDGSTIVATSFVNTNLVSTNVFGSSTFAFQDNLGEAFSGTYTLTKFTAVGAFIVETVTDPPSEAATNCIVLTITDGGAPSIGYYDYESLDSSTNEPFDLGTFVLNPGTASTTFVGPATLDGLKGTVSPVGEPPFIRTYGNGTFASLSLLSSNEPTDVGINLANTRISSDTGTDQFIGLGPPYIMGLDDETVDATFTLADKANYVVEGDPSRRGTITYTKLTTNVPVAITGHTITAKPKGKGEISVVSFTNNTFRSINSADTGTYTYAPYSPTMALVQANFTGGSETGTTDYVILEFTTTMGGPYVSARADPASAGGWEYESGNFTFTKTK
jgi:hypothetical protein